MEERPDWENELDEQVEVREPPRFAVLLLNDDYSTMDFVIEVLMRFFGKTYDQAYEITLAVHQQGRGVAGIYGRDIAETKAEQVMETARSRGFPLKAEVEQISGSEDGK